jgi:hypothetical protein
MATYTVPTTGNKRSRKSIQARAYQRQVDFAFKSKSIVGFAFNSNSIVGFAFNLIPILSLALLLIPKGSRHSNITKLHNQYTNWWRKNTNSCSSY